MHRYRNNIRNIWFLEKELKRAKKKNPSRYVLEIRGDKASWNGLQARESVAPEQTPSLDAL